MSEPLPSPLSREERERRLQAHLDQRDRRRSPPALNLYEAQAPAPRKVQPVARARLISEMAEVARVMRRSRHGSRVLR